MLVSAHRLNTDVVHEGFVERVGRTGWSIYNPELDIAGCFVSNDRSVLSVLSANDVIVGLSIIELEEDSVLVIFVVRVPEDFERLLILRRGQSLSHGVDVVSIVPLSTFPTPSLVLWVKVTREGSIGVQEQGVASSTFLSLVTRYNGDVEVEDCCR